VSERILSGPETYSGHRQTGRECVAQIVPMEIRDSGFLNGFLEPVTRAGQGLAFKVADYCARAVATLP
jgi:hypothetical protein